VSKEKKKGGGGKVDRGMPFSHTQLGRDNGQKEKKGFGGGGDRREGEKKKKKRELLWGRGAPFFLLL